MTQREAFLELQREQFDRADVEHFLWQTQGPVFSQTERELLAGLLLAPRRFLEVGCGEGGNLFHLFALELGHPELSVGLDLFYQKVRFAKDQLPQTRFICADAHALPFEDHSFDAILCRDVLHHVAEPARVVAELSRVCAPGGSVIYLEPNRSNPIMWCVATFRPFERGILRRSARDLEAMMRPYAATMRVEYRHPMPISRVVLHHQFGLAKLGQFPWVGRALRALEAGLGLCVPERWRSYLCFVATQRADSREESSVS